MSNFIVKPEVKYSLTFNHWEEDMKKVSFVSLLRDKAGLSFLHAKKSLETLLLGEPFTIEVKNLHLAKWLSTESAKLGVKSKLNTPVTTKFPLKVKRGFK